MLTNHPRVMNPQWGLTSYPKEAGSLFQSKMSHQGLFVRFDYRLTGSYKLYYREDCGYSTVLWSFFSTKGENTQHQSTEESFTQLHSVDVFVWLCKTDICPSYPATSCVLTCVCTHSVPCPLAQRQTLCLPRARCTC